MARLRHEQQASGAHWFTRRGKRREKGWLLAEALFVRSLSVGSPFCGGAEGSSRLSLFGSAWDATCWASTGCF